MIIRTNDYKMVLLRLAGHSLIIGLGIGLLMMDGLVLAAGGLIFLSGLILTARFCLKSEFNELYSNAYNFGFLSFIVSIPYFVIVAPKRQSVRRVGELFVSLIGETFYFAISSGFFWVFITMLAMMMVKVVQGVMSEDSPPMAEDLE